MKRLSFFRSLLFGIATFGMTAIPVIAQVNGGDESDYSSDSDAVYAQDVPAYAPASASARGGYAHVTAMEGSASVLSDANGRTDMRLNLPLSESDQIVT